MRFYTKARGNVENSTYAGKINTECCGKYCGKVENLVENASGTGKRRLRERGRRLVYSLVAAHRLSKGLFSVPEALDTADYRIEQADDHTCDEDDIKHGMHHKKNTAPGQKTLQKGFTAKPDTCLLRPVYQMPGVLSTARGCIPAAAACERRWGGGILPAQPRERLPVRPRSGCGGSASPIPHG